MNCAAVRPFRMAISRAFHSSCTNRSSVVSLTSTLSRDLCPSCARQACCLTGLNRSLPWIHTSRTPQRLYITAAAPVTAPPTTDQSILYVRIGISILCFCASIFFVSLVFLVRRLFSTVEKLNATIDTINEELPGVAASVRLTSLEMADCILEFAGLGRDVSGGVRAGGRALKATEASLQESGAALKSVWENYIRPGINKRLKASKDIWDYTLETNADLDRDPTAAEVAAVTRMSIAELRQSLSAISALHQVVVQGLRVMSAVQPSPRDRQADGGETDAATWQDRAEAHPSQAAGSNDSSKPEPEHRHHPGPTLPRSQAVQPPRKVGDVKPEGPPESAGTSKKSDPCQGDDSAA
eukprot:jgi/Ulvmu1/5088/UM021_0105.1